MFVLIQIRDTMRVSPEDFDKDRIVVRSLSLYQFQLEYRFFLFKFILSHQFRH